MLTVIVRQHMLTCMETNLSDLTVQLADPDVGVGLRAVAALGVLHTRLEHVYVERARKNEWSWQEIAAALGVTKQTIHRKYARRMP